MSSAFKSQELLQWQFLYKKIKCSEMMIQLTVAKWHHMAAYIWVNIGLDNGWLPHNTKPLLNQYWLIIKGVLWHSPESNFTRSAQSMINMYSNTIFLNLLPHFSGPNEFMEGYDMTYLKMFYNTVKYHACWGSADIKFQPWYWILI